MRIRRRSAIVLASAAALGVGLIAFPGSAAAEPVVPTCAYVVSPGNRSCVRLKVTPALPPSHQLGIRWRTLFTSPGNKASGGFPKTVTLLFDDDFSFNFAAGGANCTAAALAGKNIAQAYAACGPSGTNAYLSTQVPGAPTLSGRASTAPPSNFGGCTMVFKGPTANKVLLYMRVYTQVNSTPACTAPATNTGGNATMVVVGTFGAANVPGYGRKLTIPNLDALPLPLDDFYATIKKADYFTALCPNGATPWRLRGIFEYSGNGGGGIDGAAPPLHQSNQAC
jgi:hypothetical protein